MKTRLLFLLVVFVACILIFVWGVTNYLICYTDTPGGANLPDQCFSMSLDHFAIPALFAVFVMMGIIITLTWMKTKNHKLRIVFTALSGVGIFFGFNGILAIILMFRN